MKVVVLPGPPGHRLENVLSDPELAGVLVLSFALFAVSCRPGAPSSPRPA